MDGSVPEKKSSLKMLGLTFSSKLDWGSYIIKGEKCSGRKHSKVRLTGLVAGNVYGERLQMFDIGNSVKPLCFKGVKTLPCRYHGQHRS